VKLQEAENQIVIDYEVYDQRPREVSGILCEDRRMELERSTFYGDQERDFRRTFGRVGR
jgi:hypothetical protein